MDTVLNKISEIESAASQIMEEANARKKAFARKMEEKTTAFDTELETETSKKISELRAQMEVDMKAKLSKQQSDADQVLKGMEENYKAHHSAYAKKLFHALTEE